VHRRGQSHDRVRPGAGHRQPGWVGRCQRVGRREQPPDAAERGLELLAVVRREPAGDGGRAGHGHLLADDGAHRQLAAVHVSGHPSAGRTAGEPAEQLVAAERVHYRVRIRVEVEQSPAALHGRAEVASVVEPQRCVHVALGRGQLCHARAVGQSQAASIGAVHALLDPRDRAGAQVAEQPGAVERRAVGEADAQGPGPLGRVAHGRAGEASWRPSTELTWRHRVDPADRLVELADAREAGGEGHLGDRERGGLEQHPGGLRPARAGQLQRSRPQLLHQPPVQVALGVAEPPREAGHALAIDNAVGDQSHRAAHEVRARVPLWRARHGVRPAAHARAEAGGLSGGGAREEAHVLGLRLPRGAARAAVDPCCRDGCEEPTVESGVSGFNGAEAVLEVEHHRGTMTRGGVKVWPNRTWSRPASEPVTIRFATRVLHRFVSQLISDATNLEGEVTGVRPGESRGRPRRRPAAQPPAARSRPWPVGAGPAAAAESRARRPALPACPSAIRLATDQ
jgi:hypothetical protein